MTTRPAMLFVSALLLGSPAVAADDAAARLEAMAGIEGAYALAAAEAPATTCTITLTGEWIDPKMQTLAKASADETCGKVSELFAPTKTLSWMVRDPAAKGFEIQSRPNDNDGAPDVIDFAPAKEQGNYDGKMPLGEGKSLNFTLSRAMH